MRGREREREMGCGHNYGVGGGVQGTTANGDIQLPSVACGGLRAATRGAYVTCDAVLIESRCACVDSRHNNPAYPWGDRLQGLLWRWDQMCLVHMHCGFNTMNPAVAVFGSLCGCADRWQFP